jgi:hypothetical protein
MTFSYKSDWLHTGIKSILSALLIPNSANFSSALNCRGKWLFRSTNELNDIVHALFLKKRFRYDLSQETVAPLRPKSVP